MELELVQLLQDKHETGVSMHVPAGDSSEGCGAAFCIAVVPQLLTWTGWCGNFCGTAVGRAL
jgi:hypothetical protein